MRDWDAIDEYVKTRSETAFAEIVSRYVDLVYSSALRSVDGDASLAEDATQRTFCLLAKKSASLSRKTAIVGWLYKTAANTARDLARGERRRRFYEQKAATMMTVSTESADDATWAEIAPQLEDAMGMLGENDRVALLERYFQRKSIREVGQTLGVSEDAAKMRLSRSLDRLREQLARRGVTTATAALGAALLADSVCAAPAALAAASLKSALTVPIATMTASTLTEWIAMSALKKSGRRGRAVIHSDNAGDFPFHPR